MDEKKRIGRRRFLQKSAVVAFSAAIAKEGVAQSDKPSGSPVNCGVIGTGVQGRALLTQLLKMPEAKVTALCDIYRSNLKKAYKLVGEEIRTYDDYRKMLDSEKETQAVVIATPLNLHSQMAMDALAAGKHVFCESALAHTIEECKKVARAAQQAKTVFQVGHQRRSNPLYRHTLSFFKAGLIGDVQQARAQWHLSNSWRRPVRDRRDEKLLNWRLYRACSGGLMAEYGSHQLDVVNWFLNGTPLSVTGVGGINHWKDGREVYDNVQLIFQYPEGVKVIYSSMLNSSFQGHYELFIGTQGAILLIGGRKGLLFKEPDAAAFGWEMYAKKEMRGDAEGILLDANATKLEKKEDTAVVRAGEAHADFYRELQEFLAAARDGKKVPCDAQTALNAAVACIVANGAMEKGTEVKFGEADFEA